MAKILICDDEEAVRNLIKTQLEAEGHECLTAKDGRDGYDQTFNVDLVITDLMMPNWPGEELIKFSKSRFIVITGHTGDKRIQELKNNVKVIKVFTKPWKREDLLEVVNSNV